MHLFNFTEELWIRKVDEHDGVDFVLFVVHHVERVHVDLVIPCWVEVQDCVHDLLFNLAFDVLHGNEVVLRDGPVDAQGEEGGACPNKLVMFEVVEL